MIYELREANGARAFVTVTQLVDGLVEVDFGRGPIPAWMARDAARLILLATGTIRPELDTDRDQTGGGA